MSFFPWRGNAFLVAITPVMVLALLGLAGCGASRAATAATTTACPTRTATNATQTVTGKLTSLQPTGATLTTTTETTTSVTFTTTTRFTVLTAVSATKLAVGGMVQVFAGAANAIGGTDAQRIIVQTGTTGFGPGTGPPISGNRPGRNSFNPACRTQGTPGAAAFRGVRGTIAALNLEANTITITDARGGSYSFTLIASTVIGSQSTGAIANLHVGDTLSATGTTTSTGLQALSVQDQTAH